MDDQNLNEVAESQASAVPTTAASEPAGGVAAQDVTYGVEKFSASDLNTLRSELLQSGVDSFQAAEIVTSFLSGRGYGCSPLEARSVASTIEVRGATEEHIQAALEHVARVM